MSSHFDDANQGAEHEFALIRKVAAGEREAFRTLYTDYYPRLNRFFIKLLGWGSEALCEELLNDTLFTVWQKAGDFRGDSKVSTWIFGIAYFKGIKAMRRNHFPSEPLPELIDEEMPDVVVNRESLQRLIVSSLQCLSVEQRMVVELTYYNGCSYQEISDIMAVPVNTVKTRMFHARLKLRDKLKRFEAGLYSDDG